VRAHFDVATIGGSKRSVRVKLLCRLADTINEDDLGLNEHTLLLYCLVLGIEYTLGTKKRLNQLSVSVNRD
jgi:hypothetical protein